MLAALPRFTGLIYALVGFFTLVYLLRLGKVEGEGRYTFLFASAFTGFAAFVLMFPL